jgi:hypothetical protein
MVLAGLAGKHVQPVLEFNLGRFEFQVLSFNFEADEGTRNSKPETWKLQTGL